MSPEIWFYGGLILLAVSVLWLIVTIFLFNIRKKNLDMQLDLEYGKRRNL